MTSESIFPPQVARLRTGTKLLDWWLSIFLRAAGIFPYKHRRPPSFHPLISFTFDSWFLLSSVDKAFPIFPCASWFFIQVTSPLFTWSASQTFWFHPPSFSAVPSPVETSFLCFVSSRLQFPVQIVSLISLTSPCTIFQSTPSLINIFALLHFFCLQILSAFAPQAFSATFIFASSPKDRRLVLAPVFLGAGLSKPHCQSVGMNFLMALQKVLSQFSFFTWSPFVDNNHHMDAQTLPDQSAYSYMRFLHSKFLPIPSLVEVTLEDLTGQSTASLPLKVDWFRWTMRMRLFLRFRVRSRLQNPKVTHSFKMEPEGICSCEIFE